MDALLRIVELDTYIAYVHTSGVSLHAVSAGYYDPMGQSVSFATVNLSGIVSCVYYNDILVLATASSVYTITKTALLIGGDVTASLETKIFISPLRSDPIVSITGYTDNFAVGYTTGIDFYTPTEKFSLYTSNSCNKLILTSAKLCFIYIETDSALSCNIPIADWSLRDCYPLLQFPADYIQQGSNVPAIKYNDDGYFVFQHQNNSSQYYFYFYKLDLDTLTFKFLFIFHSPHHVRHYDFKKQYFATGSATQPRAFIYKFSEGGLTLLPRVDPKRSTTSAGFDPIDFMCFTKNADYLGIGAIENEPYYFYSRQGDWFKRIPYTKTLQAWRVLGMAASNNYYGIAGSSSHGQYSMRYHTFSNDSVVTSNVSVTYHYNFSFQANKFISRNRYYNVSGNSFNYVGEFPTNILADEHAGIVHDISSLGYFIVTTHHWDTARMAVKLCKWEGDTAILLDVYHILMYHRSSTVFLPDGFGKPFWITGKLFLYASTFFEVNTETHTIERMASWPQSSVGQYEGFSIFSSKDAVATFLINDDSQVVSDINYIKLAVQLGEFCLVVTYQDDVLLAKIVDNVFTTVNTIFILPSITALEVFNNFVIFKLVSKNYASVAIYKLDDNSLVSVINNPFNHFLSNRNTYFRNALFLDEKLFLTYNNQPGLEIQDDLSRIINFTSQAFSENIIANEEHILLYESVFSINDDYCDHVQFIPLIPEEDL